MKKVFLLYCLLVITAGVSAQITIPTGVSNVVVPCGTNNYAATVVTGTGGTGVEWFSDYLCTTSLGTNGTYNGATATSTMIFAKSTNGAASSADPKQVYIFKPQIPTASFTTVNSCSGVDVTVVVDTLLDSLTTIVLEDATIDPNVPGTNYDNNFLMVRPTGFCGGNVNFLTKYDVGVIPPNVTPVYSRSSTVAYSGFAHGGNGTVYEQFVANDGWDETTVTFATAPMPALPSNTADNIGSWWVWYGFPSLTVAHYDAATMGGSNEGDKPQANANILLNQQVITERAGDQTLSMFHFSPGYDSRYYAKNHKTNTSLLPQLKTIFSYNQAATCTYSWVGPGGFTAATQNISGLTVSGLYTLTITSAFGCIGVMNANIVVPPGALDVDPLADIVACDSIQLPAITGSSLVTPAYYTGLGGSGTSYNPGDWISTSGTYYIYDQTGTVPNCTDEETFTITIIACGCNTTMLSETFDQAVIVGANGPALYGNGGSDHNAAYALSGTFFGWFNIQNGIGPVDIYDRSINGLSVGCTIDASIWIRESYGGANIDISLIDDFGAVLATTNLTLNGIYQQVTLTTVATTPGLRYLIHFNGVGGNGLDIVTEDLLITQSCNSANGTDTQVACGSYLWINGINYVANNNTATHTIVAGAANGCDSIVTLDLTINNPVNSSDVQVACGSYLWIDGINYVANNNTATHTIVAGAANGCDSIVTLDLTINNPVNSSDVQVACGSYLWIDGINYVANNNTATHTIVGGAANGCDSIITLDLTITNGVNSIDVQVACGSYLWIDGINYVANNNVATQTIVGGAANGCDSIITLNLTINNPVNSTDVQVACGSYLWIDGINYVANNNTATHTIVAGAANGCDSIITLDLTITSDANSTDIQVACDSFVWIDGINYVANNNTATQTIVGGAANGCDSIITLNLTINPTPTVTVPNDLIYCKGEITLVNIFTSTNPGTTYTWTNSNTAIGLVANGIGNIPVFTATNSTGAPISGVISVTPSANGCVGLPVNYNIIVSPAITFTKVITPISCFAANDGQIAITPISGTPNFNYTWSVPGVGNSALATGLLPGQVTVTVEDANGCSEDSTFTIFEPAQIIVSFLSDRIDGCPGESVEFYIQTDTTLISSLTWNLGNGTTVSGSHSDFDTISTVYPNPGSYDVSLTITDTSVAGCSNTLPLSGYITIHDNPIANFSYAPTDATVFDPTIYFTDLSQINITNWDWDFDGLGASTDQNPIFVFPEDTGNYLVTLTVIDNNTCTNNITQNVKIFGEFGIFIPNSFTPDQNGRNDLFNPIGFGISEVGYSFMIFDRWGELIFETHALSDGWDGTYKGKLVPNDTFVWRVIFHDLDGVKHEQTGHINALR